MDTKSTFLDQVRRAGIENLVSEQELVAAYRALQTEEKRKTYKHIHFVDILYSLGGAIVILGIVVLLWQNWDALNSISRVASSLGSAIAAYVVGALLWNKKEMMKISLAFFTIATFTLPIGLFVTLHEAGYDEFSSGSNTVISAILALVFGMSMIIFRHVLFTGFLVLFVTWLFFSLTNYLFIDHVSDVGDFFSYRFLISGVSILLLGYGLQHAWEVTASQHSGGNTDVSVLWSYENNSNNESIVQIFNIMGLMFIFGAALALGGYKPNQSILWELAYPVLVFVFIYMGVQLHQRTYVIASSAFFMLFILKITAEYFSDALGWPLALVVCGLLLIGTGYGMMKIIPTSQKERLSAA